MSISTGKEKKNWLFSWFVMEFVKIKMIVKNFDNKQSFLFSEVSRASQEKKAKKMLARRAELWE